MNWQTVAVQRLKSYEARKTAMEAIPERVRLLEMQFTSIRAAKTDATPVQEEGNKREEMLVGNISQREELQKNYKIAKREVDLTEKGLAALTEREQRVLYMFYINRQHGHIDRLCSELNVEKSTVYRMKDDALRKFTMAMYGVVDL